MSVQYGASGVKPAFGNKEPPATLALRGEFTPKPQSNSKDPRHRDDPDAFYVSSPTSEYDDDELPSGAKTPLPVVTENEIVEWHQIHKPAKEIRTIRWTFNSKTTSSLNPSVLFQHLHKALDDLNEAHYGNLKYSRVDDYYMMLCSYSIPNRNETVSFELEVCKVWLLKVHGVKIKRISGDPLIFKDLYTELVELLDLKGKE